MQLALGHISTDRVDFLKQGDVSVHVLRLDKIHPVISGNKWFKLQYYLEDAKKQQKKKIVTFGGAWSNHIVATAAAASMHGLSSAGIIRGEKPSHLSPTLEKAMQYGMELHFISREAYGKKEIPFAKKDDEYYISEGGYGEKGAEGASDILNYADKNFTHYCCATGTGTMTAGLVRAVAKEQKVVGISVMKNNEDLQENVRALLHETHRDWEIIHDYHFGGYAKQKPALISFMNDFYRQTSVPSDFVYTGKLFYAINDLISINFFPGGSRLLLIHSGGLQGNVSLEKGTLIF